MFLVNISHEIITPLNAIIGTTDILLDSDVSPHIKEMASNISNSSHALLSITSDLLDFSRMNLDDVVINEEEYDISALLNDVINLMSVRLLDSNVSFYVNVNPGLKKILIGDSNKIRQIFVNLLSNAIKYTKEGSITFDVDFDVLSEDTLNLKIRVLDTGIGIKPENLELIFEARHRSGAVETDRSYEGNGLGLAYCRKICNAMGGKLWADSVFGEGSAFHFETTQKFHKGDYRFCGTVNDMNMKVLYYLENGLDSKALKDILVSMNVNFVSALKADEFIDKVSDDSFDFYMLGSATYEKIKERLYAGKIDFKKIVVISACNYSYSGEPFEYVLTTPLSCLNMADLLNRTSNYAVRRKSFQGSFEMPEVTVLVIDDNLVNLGVAKEMIQRYGSNILTAASGREGLICLKQENIDIVFLDYMMPDMDGIDTLKKIRSSKDIKNPDLPVVALTANVVSGAKEMFIKAGFDDYLPKPINVDQLEKTFIKLLPADKIKVKVDNV
jgi:CheY-like chemotaxis protein